MKKHALKSSRFPLVVSFYTKDSLYQLQAHHLKASCEKLGVEHWIEGVDSWGSWELNCAYKPFFLLEKLQQFQRPLLWVDADAVFMQKPTELEVFKQDFAAFCDAELPDDHPSKVRSGTLYVNSTEGGVLTLQEWAAECHRQLTNPERQEEFWDQIALRDLLLPKKQGAFGVLPLPYIQILGHPGDVKKSSDPVILHTQSSRVSK